MIDRSTGSDAWKKNNGGQLFFYKERAIEPIDTRTGDNCLMERIINMFLA